MHIFVPERTLMSKSNQNETLANRQRRQFLQALGGQAGVTLFAGLASTAGVERATAEQQATLVETDEQGNVSNTIRDANNTINRSSSAGGWAVRNVGFQNHRSASTPLLIAAATNSGQSAVIEGCYFGDGGNGPAVFVDPDHAGTLTIRNSYFEGWGDNAIYGSPPGNPSGHPDPGSGGVVKVENCYSKNNAISNFRLGTDGSYVRNCVSLASQRGYWGFYGRTRVLDCDIRGGIHASDNKWQDPAVVTVENTRFSGGTHRHYDGATIEGTSQGSPREYNPGVPSSPTAAKNGNRN